MNPYDRPTDSLPISRRTVIMNTGLAAARSPASAPARRMDPHRPLSPPRLPDQEAPQPGEALAHRFRSRKQTFRSAAARSLPTPRR